VDDVRSEKAIIDISTFSKAKNRIPVRLQRNLTHSVITEWDHYYGTVTRDGEKGGRGEYIVHEVVILSAIADRLRNHYLCRYKKKT